MNKWREADDARRADQRPPKGTENRLQSTQVRPTQSTFQKLWYEGRVRFVVSVAASCRRRGWAGTSTLDWTQRGGRQAPFSSQCASALHRSCQPACSPPSGCSPPRATEDWASRWYRLRRQYRQVFRLSRYVVLHIFPSSLPFRSHRNHSRDESHSTHTTHPSPVCTTSHRHPCLTGRVASSQGIARVAGVAG
jgi:hypothetical protein